MTPRRIAGVFEAVASILEGGDLHSFVWKKVTKIKAHLFEEQNFDKSLALLQAFKQHPLFEARNCFKVRQVFLFVALMECVCLYKRGDFKNFLDCLRALNAEAAAFDWQSGVEDQTGPEDSTSRSGLHVGQENLEYLARQSSQLRRLVLQYEIAVQELVSLEKNLPKLDDTALFRYASLVANFNKEKALKALCMIIRRNSSQESQQALSAATNILSSIACVNQKRPLLTRLNESLRE